MWTVAKTRQFKERIIFISSAAISIFPFIRFVPQKMCKTKCELMHLPKFCKKLGFIWMENQQVVLILQLCAMKQLLRKRKRNKITRLKCRTWKPGGVLQYVLICSAVFTQCYVSSTF